jgi:hypothetical protein
MSFGNQTLVFTVTTGTGEYDDFGAEIVTETTESAHGCRNRPLSAAEAAEAYGDVARQVWRATCPPSAAVTAAKSTGKFTEGGREFHIIGGPKPFQNFSAAVKVTIDSEFYPE